MTLTLSDLDFLASDAGACLLDSLAREDLSQANTLALLTRLRKTYPAAQASAALETARLRIKAADKFGDDAARMFFTREALEQASHPLVRRYRAQTLSGGGVVDACCGIGSDSLAFAASASTVLGLDIDPLRVAMARYNAAALPVENARFETADVRDGLPQADLIFFDPARRDEAGKRIFDVERCQPPLPLVREWDAPRIAVKLSPGVDLAQLTPYGGRVEFISVAGDLKEALLWIGGDSTGLSATLLTDSGVYRWPQPEQPESAPLSKPRRWLVEPDPALMRAGLVQNAALAVGGWMLDETIAYFTTETEPDSPWLRAWKIVDWIPFNLKKLRADLRQRGIGHITVKKRGSPLTPEELISRLKLKGDGSCTLVLTRHDGAPIVMICEDFVPPVLRESPR